MQVSLGNEKRFDKRAKTAAFTKCKKRGKGNLKLRFNTLFFRCRHHWGTRKVFVNGPF